MGSLIEIKKDNNKWIYLSQNQTKHVIVNETQCTLQVHFFLLKSSPVLLRDNGCVKEIEITMNPMLIWIYVILFIGMLVVPVFHLSIIGIFVLVIFYVVWVVSMLKKAYLIKESA